MRQVTSSTLPSKHSPLWTTLSVLSWMVLWLLIFELLLYLVIPPAPATVKSNQLQRYLEYGRSVEGKIRQMIGPSDKTTIPVTLAGWIDPERKRWKTVPMHPEKPDGLLIAIYGMSHAQHMGWALDKIEEPPVTVRFLGGPGAPPNHSFKTYQMDRGRHTAGVVIFGIAAGSLKGMTTFTSLNQAFEYPLPYTYPKYRKVGNNLKEIWPQVRTMTDFRRVLNDEMLWNDYVREMQAEDSYYHPFIFYENFMDNFVIFRFIRRSWAKKHARSVKDNIYEVSQGFKEGSEMLQALRLMVKEFARQVRNDGKLPIVVLFNNRGYSNHLTQALAKKLQEADIPFVDSHTSAPSDDPKNLASDNFHFSKEVDKQLAQAALEIIHEHKIMPEKVKGERGKGERGNYSQK